MSKLGMHSYFPVLIGLLIILLSLAILSSLWTNSRRYHDPQFMSTLIISQRHTWLWNARHGKEYLYVSCFSYILTVDLLYNTKIRTILCSILSAQIINIGAAPRIYRQLAHITA